LEASQNIEGLNLLTALCSRLERKDAQTAKKEGQTCRRWKLAELATSSKQEL
jgi:hypothetical protein